jgi:hypothetical protein
MNPRFHQHRIILLLLALMGLAALFSVPGCASTKKSWKYARNGDFKRAVGLKSTKPVPPEIPNRIVSTWTDTVLRRSDKAPQRGFGGRLMFFMPDSADPVRVDGQLVVYAFDETDREKHVTHPNRKYVFPREEFARHESESQLGPSYSVWLPWDEVGGTMKQVSLIAKFEPHGGTYVMGEQTKHLLPGLDEPSSEHLVSADGVGPVEVAQHTEGPVVKSVVARTSAEAPIVVPAGSHSSKDISTTTIALPKKWEKRLNAGPD